MTSAATPRQRSRESRHSVWLTVAEVLDELGIERSTWEKWRQRGIAPNAVRLPNGQLRIRREWLDDWLKSLPLSS